MTNKIPVGRTIAHSYGFAFGNIVNNLGAIWMPVAILYALYFLFAKRYMAAVLQVGCRLPWHRWTSERARGRARRRRCRCS